MNENMLIEVPYRDFVDGQKAIADLAILRMLAGMENYCPDYILVTLGLPQKNTEISFAELLGDDDAGIH